MNEKNKQNKLSKRQKKALACKIKRAEKGKPKVSKFRMKHRTKLPSNINSPFYQEE